MKVFAANRLRGVVVYASSSLRPAAAFFALSPTIDSCRRFGIPTQKFPRHRESIEENALRVAYS
jgi:hypothetical protein